MCDIHPTVKETNVKLECPKNTVAGLRPQPLFLKDLSTGADKTVVPESHVSRSLNVVTGRQSIAGSLLNNLAVQQPPRWSFHCGQAAGRPEIRLTRKEDKNNHYYQYVSGWLVLLACLIKTKLTRYI